MTIAPQLRQLHDPVVIASFKSVDEAAKAEQFLSRSGIAGEVLPRTERFERLCVDVFRGGHDVLVSRTDSDRAIDLVQSLWPDPEQSGAAPVCRVCGSRDVAMLPRLQIVLVAAIVLLAGNIITGERDLFLLLSAIVAALVTFAPNLRCRSCGERWRSS